ncbi:MerC domain-containing protein [Colwellia echini]|uniref:MerC domain-containing protein n=1 Tax=Colwellia echini TaxID=1982103 RepID=A0ABY3MX16_9GAMM|nr:MerC domain-containing protein [Colwellia echini]TYK65750.1 MerC domain-containing protein [Colwellia echini]
MKSTQVVTDKIAIGISMLCAIHCLLLPLILVLLPSLGALQLQNEAFHLWMLIAVIPISTYALTLGCKKHKNYYLLAWGVLGLVLMILAVLFGHEIAGESGEKLLTLFGAMFVSIAHWQNFKRCQQDVKCKH